MTALTKLRFRRIVVDKWLARVRSDWSPEVAREAGNRAARECLDTLDNAAFGAASPTQPKFVAKSDPAAQWTRAEDSRRPIAVQQVG